MTTLTIETVATTPKELASAMLDRLRARREFDADGYMVSLRELADQTAPETEPAVVLKAIQRKPFKDQTVIAAVDDLDSPVALRADVDVFAQSMVLHEYLTKKAPREAGMPYYFGDLKKRIKCGIGDVTSQLEKAYEEALKKRQPLDSDQQVVWTKPSQEDRLVLRLISVLRSQRPLGGKCYPLTLERLAELAEISSTNRRLVLAATQKKSFKNGALTASKSWDAPAALKEDIDLLADSPLTLRFALGSVRTEKTHLHTISKIGEKVTSTKGLQGAFKKALNERVAKADLPEGVMAILDRGKPKLFSVDDLIPPLSQQIEKTTSSAQTTAAHDHATTSKTPPTAASGSTASAQPMVLHSDPVAQATTEPHQPESSDFAAQFDAAFERLDHDQGGYNLVSLAELRAALDEYARSEFDQRLNELRRAGRYTLSEGQSKSGIPQHEREAGIQEAGSLLIHVSRRT